MLTVAGALLAVDAALFAARWPWVALALIVASVLCDALDGAVASLSGAASASGAAADRVADRISDLAFALVLWRCGAPLWLAVAAGLLMLAVEVVRGRVDATAITVAERPTRTICAVLACASAGVSVAAWPATACAAVWVAAHLLALAQLATRGSGRPDQLGDDRG